MTREEIVRAWQRLRFRLDCAEKTGAEFQALFEEIMEKAEPRFIKVKPAGRAGDWKCDGWLPERGRCFQVYAPEEMTAEQAVAKISADFEGAKAHWREDMKEWVFVWSSAHRGLYPQIVDQLNDLRESNPTIEVGNWGREALWEVVAGLRPSDRDDLFGPAPVLEVVTGTTDAEVRTLLNYVRDQEIPELDDDLGHVGLEEKMDKNQLDDNAGLLIKAAQPVISTVDHYVSKNVDPRFSQRVATVLKQRYEEFAEQLDADASAVFAALVVQVAGDFGPATKEYWAAVAIITYYFELCDIFER